MALWFIFCLVAIYHMFKFGFKNLPTFLVTFIFIVGAFFLLWASYEYISQIDWTINVSILEGMLSSNPFN